MKATYSLTLEALEHLAGAICPPRALHRFSALACLLSAVSGPALADTEVNLDPIPGYYQEPGLSPNRDYTNQHAQETVDPFSGKLQLHYVDLMLPGNGGMDIKVQRSYSSGDGFLRDPSPYGVGWTMGYGRVLRKASYEICDMGHGSLVNPVLELPNGSRQILYVTQDTPQSQYYLSPSRWKAVCVPTGAGARLAVYSPDGTRYDMFYDGQTIGATPTEPGLRAYYPVQITDRNGNTLSLTHDRRGTTDAITSIVAPDGRQVTFTYTAAGILESVKDASGRKQFVYTTKPAPNVPPSYVFLTAVQRPDGNSWKYDYNEAFDNTPGAGSVRKLTYPGGGSLDYVYDKSIQFARNVAAGTVHVVKQKVDNRGNTWAYTYTPATTRIPPDTHSYPCPSANGWLDMTQVTGPEGTVLYCHVGFNSISTENGLGYAVGTLGTKMYSDSAGITGGFVYAESSGFEPDLISDRQSMIRKSDAVVIANKVYGVRYYWTQKTRDNQSYETSYSNYDDYGNARTVAELGTPTQPGGAKESRTTQLVYKVNTGKWILHQVQDETVTVNGESLGTTTRSIDGNGNQLSLAKQGVTTEWTYFASGDVQTKTDGRGYVAIYSNYKCGIPQSESHPINAKTVAAATEVATTVRVVDGECNITSVTDPENAKTTFTYDGLGRITNIKHPLASSSEVGIVWTASSRRITRGPSGSAARYVEQSNYDGYGRVTSYLQQDVRTSKTLLTVFVNDALGRHIYKSYPNAGIGTGVYYNVLGEPYLQGQGCPAPSGPASLACTAWTASTWSGHVNVETDEKGRRTVTTFRGFGDPGELEAISIQPPDPAANTTLVRNGMGQITQVTQGGVTRSFEYMPTTYFLGKATDPETGVTTYGRDEVGNMTSRKVGAAGGTIGYAYDGLNRVTEVKYPAGTPSVLKTYYKDDKPRSVINGTISGGAIASPITRREYEYDVNKNLKRETLTVAGAPTPFVIDRTYNNNDALDTVKYGADQTITYAPDAFGRPAKAAPFVTALQYNDANGQVSSIKYANGTTTTVSSDAARLWPVRVTHAQASYTDTLAGRAFINGFYSYDPAGNLELTGDPIDQSYARLLGYDSLDRLVSMQGPWGAGSAAYDATGNLLSQSFGGATVNYQYDNAKNLLKSTSGAKSYQYTYDNYGNVANNGVQSFTYNDASNLVCTKCGTAAEVSYVYDGTGLRVAETSASNGTTYYVYDGSGQLLWERSGQISKRYAYVAGRQVAVDQVAPAGTAGAGQAGGSTALKVTVTPSSTTAAIGADITYTVVVKNTGSQLAADVKIVDVLPQGISFVSASPGCNHASGVVTCAIGTVAAAGTVTLQIVGRTAAVLDAVNAVSVTSGTTNAAAPEDMVGIATVSVQKRTLSPQLLLLLLNAL